MNKRALLCLVTAMAFLTYTVGGLTMSYAAPKTAVVEVGPGTITGKITDFDEKPLEGKSVKILDSMGTVKFSAITDKDGKYSIENLSAGTYTVIMASSMKATLLVKPGSENTLINAMVPMTTQPYSGSAIGGLSAPLVVAIGMGAVMVGVAAYGIAAYDSSPHAMTPVSP
jgi:hypothetical protein